MTTWYCVKVGRNVNTCARKKTDARKIAAALRRLPAIKRRVSVVTVRNSKSGGRISQIEKELGIKPRR